MKRFWNKVDKSGECWLWTACKINDGYGHFKVKTGTLILAHRYAWELINGPIPNGMCVCHTCDNPGCVNIDHLFLSDHAGNMADKAAKRRSNHGEKSPFARLCKVDVRLIRDLDKTVREISDWLHIPYSTVWYVKNRKTWKHVA